MCPCTFPGIFLSPIGNCQGTHKVFDINTGVVRKPHTVTLLPMPDRVIKVVNDWGCCHAKEDITHSLTFLNCKKELYDWDNDSLQDDKGLIKPDNHPDISHPELTDELPLVNIKLEQPHQHHVVKVLKASNDEQINTAIHNALLDNLPHQTTGVLRAINEIKINDWIKHYQNYKDPYNDLPAMPSVVIAPLIVMTVTIQEDTLIPIMTTQAIIADEDLGSIIIGGQQCSARVPAPRQLTKVGFNNKSYSDGKYKDDTIHIAVGTGHDANHPSLIDPDPLLHALGTTMLHYNSPNVQAIVFAQVSSFKAGLKKFGDVGSKAAANELTQLHDYQVYNPVEAASLTLTNC
jgi:hypothetical protein